MAPQERGGRGSPPSLERTIQTDFTRGSPRARAWPRKQSASTKAKNAERIEWFRQAQLLAQYLPMQQQIIAREATAGTPLMPRDILTMAMSGRLFMIVTPDNQRIWPMAIRTDVSEAIDILANQKGALLVRSDDVWQALNPGTDGYFLKSNGAAELPSWGPAGGGSGSGLKTVLGITSNFSAGAQDYTFSWDQEHFDEASLWTISDPTKIIVPSNGTIKLSAGIQGTGSIFSSGSYLKITRSGIIEGQGPMANSYAANAQTPWLAAAENDEFIVQMRNQTLSRNFVARSCWLEAIFQPA